MFMSSRASQEYIIMELNIIASVHWCAEYGEKVRWMRGEKSMQAIVDEIQERYDYKVTKQYIQMLERPFSEKAPKTVSFQLLDYISKVTGHDVREIFDSPIVSKLISNAT